MKRSQDHKQKLSKLTALQTPPHVYPWRRTPINAPPRVDRTQDFSSKLLHYSLKQPREAKIKINLKNWSLKPTKYENSYQSQLSHVSVVHSQIKKIKFHIVPSFPIETHQLLILSLPRISITFLLVLLPGLAFSLPRTCTLSLLSFDCLREWFTVLRR